MCYHPSKTRYDAMIYNNCGKSGLKLPAISLGMYRNFGSGDHFEQASTWIKSFEQYLK